MKKKIALVLSAITAFSPISTFAASSNTLSKQPSALTGETLFMEEDWQGASTVNLKIGKNETDKIEYLSDGTTLFIKPTSGDIKKGDTIKISLDNANWFFRHNTSDGSSAALSFSETDSQAVSLLSFIEEFGTVKTTDATVTSAPFSNKITLNAIGIRYGINNSWFEQLARNYVDTTELQKVDAIAADVAITNAALTPSGTTVAALLGQAYTSPLPLSTKDFTAPQLIERIVTETTGANAANFVAGTNEASTYDFTKGIYYPNTKTYVKFNNFAYTGTPGANLVAYTLTVSGNDDNMATIRFYQNYAVTDFATGDAGIPFPMVSLSEGEGDVRVNIGVGSNMTSITSQNLQFGLTSANNTTTSVSEKVTAKFNFPLKMLSIKEKIPYSLEQGKITITAPYGYYFADPSVRLTTEANAQAKLPTAYAGESLFFKGNETAIENEVVTINGNNVGRYIAYAYPTDNAGITDYSKPMRDKIVINTDITPFSGMPADKTGLGLLHSVQTNGILSVDGLVLVAQNFAPTDEEIRLHIDGDGVTEEYFVVGTRKDWGVNLQTITEPTKLVSGRFADENNSADFDKDHKTARVKFSENVIASWWALRESSFTLSEGVKFRKVVVRDEKNFNHINTSYVLNNTYRPQSERTSYVMLDANEMTITDLAIQRDKTAEFQMDMWVSVEAGYDGDIILYAGGNQILEETEPVKIASAVSPITVETNVSDVKIGYQWQKVADVTITETAPSMLKRGTEMQIFIDDEITGSDSIAIAPDFITELNSDSRILFSKPTISGGAIRFEIERNSYNIPATIKFSNVYVKIDRTVPETNRQPYKIVAGGTAVAANYSPNPGVYEPKFIVKGIGADYLNVVTAANDRDSILTSVVRVTIGSETVLIGRNEQNASEIIMDTAAYISHENNSTMVPVKFVSQALGIPNEQVIWDNEARTVTIMNGARVIQFKIDSSDIIVNGVTTTMYNSNVNPAKVKAEIKDDRSFLPFRALGNALGVSVDWNEETRTATYNNDLLNETFGTVRSSEMQSNEISSSNNPFNTNTTTENLNRTAAQ